MVTTRICGRLPGQGQSLLWEESCMPRRNLSDSRYTRRCANPACGREFQQKKPNQVVCGVQCRGWLIAQVRDHSGGLRVKAGLMPRICANPECRQEYQPVRENQVACSRQCFRKTEAWHQIQQRQDARPERRVRQNELRRGERNRRAALARVGMTVEEYEVKLEAQGGGCALCGAKPKEGFKADGGHMPALHQDHDHETGQNRDLLCNRCNQGLGLFSDDPELLRAAAGYIERHR